MAWDEVERREERKDKGKGEISLFSSDSIIIRRSYDRKMYVVREGTVGRLLVVDTLRSQDLQHI